MTNDFCMCTVLVRRSDQRFDVDISELESRYKRMQMKTHPDRFTVGAGATELQKHEAEAASSALSVAYRQLRSPWSRAHVLLAARDRQPLAEDAGTGRSSSDMAMLMAVMEAREVIEDPGATAEAKRAVAADASSRLAAMLEDLAAVFAGAEAAEASGDGEVAGALLDRAEALVVEGQYRQRLLDQAEEAADRAERA